MLITSSFILLYCLSILWVDCVDTKVEQSQNNQRHSPRGGYTPQMLSYMNNLALPEYLHQQHEIYHNHNVPYPQHHYNPTQELYQKPPTEFEYMVPPEAHPNPPMMMSKYLNVFVIVVVSLRKICLPLIKNSNLF